MVEKEIAMAEILVKNLGLCSYEEAWKLQQLYFQEALDAKKIGREVQNILLVVEHPPVYTLGKSAKEENILFSEEFLGAKVFRIERGGDVTFHGPGQLVLYPILNLEDFKMSLRDYIFNMEELIIRTIADFGLKGERSLGASGVWLDVDTPKERKICALGVKASRHITMHGLAFNINTDLSWFQKINPCGFIDKGVSSLEKELGEKQDFEELSRKVLANFHQLFA